MGKGKPIESISQHRGDTTPNYFVLVEYALREKATPKLFPLLFRIVFSASGVYLYLFFRSLIGVDMRRWLPMIRRDTREK